MPSKVIKKFDENKVVRVTQELYDLDRVRWRLSIGGYRLLFALAQCLDYHTNDIFPEYSFDKKTLFKYLGLENNKDCYHQLAKILSEIQASPLQIVQQTRSGATRWAGYAWITSYTFTTDNPNVLIRLNDDVKPFLLNLRRYAAIQPKYYLRLSTEYQYWFYPYLKNVVKVGKWKISIEQLKKALYLEKTPSYDPKSNKNATENFLKYVIGIQISQKAKEEQRKAKQEKRVPALIPWDYMQDKNGQSIGTLAGISKNTDIHVCACAVKSGKAYTDIVFFLTENPKCMSKKYKEKIVDKNNLNADNDMGGKHYKPSVLDTPDLFSLPTQVLNNLVINPAYEKDIPKPQKYYYDTDRIRMFAVEINKTFEEAVKALNLKQDSEGKYYKEQ